MKPLPNRILWLMIALLAGVVLVEVGLLVVRLWPYWIARYHGDFADLQGAVLVYAPLRNVSLYSANLQETDLQSANLQGTTLTSARLWDADLRDASLQGANLAGAKLCNVDLRGANLQGAVMWGGCFGAADLTGADLRGADLRGTLLDEHAGDPGWGSAVLTGARYDARTRWPAGFDPAKHGAVKVP